MHSARIFSLVGQGFMRKFSTPFAYFLCTHLVLQNTRNMFLPVLSKLSYNSLHNIIRFSDEWKMFSVAPRRGFTPTVNPKVFFRAKESRLGTLHRLGTNLET